MITWMQRHKKYLIITIWISTIAFVGAGFVGWGQYDYGDKAGAVAKVGSVEITMGELQKSYSNLYAQYNQMFQGEFDEEKAKSFGLKTQALNFLTQQALILNLAASYDLEVSDSELLNDIRTKDYFFKNGVFSKDVYKEVLSKSNISIKEYEESTKKELLIKKTLSLLPIQTKESELKILDTATNIADKIDYKIIKSSEMTAEISDELLKPFWEGMKNSFMREASYDVKFIKQPKISKEYDEAALQEYYNENKADFKDAEGKIVAFEESKNKIKNGLDAKETKKEALKSYIAYKKGELKDVEINSATLSNSNNPFGGEALETIAKLTASSPFSKPVTTQNGEYITFELIKTTPAQPKNYEEAKGEVSAIYASQEKKRKAIEVAKTSFNTFEGTTINFITANDSDKITGLDAQEANEFLDTLFTTQNKRGFVALESGTVVMYHILEQKMLTNSNNNQENPIGRVKSSMFNDGLIKNLQNRYKTEIFIQGL